MEKALFEKNYLRIKKILRKAYESEYYKRIIDEAHIDINSDFQYEDFKRIRCSNKNIYKENQFDMFTDEIKGFVKEEYLNIKDDKSKDNYLEEHKLSLKITSGSTGQPLEVIKSLNDINKDYVSLNIQRKKLTDYDFSGKFLWVWPVNPYSIKYYDVNYETNVAFQINKYGYWFFLYEHSDENIGKLYEALIDNDCEWITSSPSVLFDLAKYICKNKLIAPALKYIECHSEKLYDWQKNTIIQVFGVIPVSIYSSNEVQFMGAVCQNGNLHIFTNTCFIEFIEEEHSNSKEVCVTSLNYTGVPIIRYKLGDCGDWDIESNCKCSLHNYPSITLSGFRATDFLITKNNTFVEPFVIFDSIYFLSCDYQLNIKQYKVIQIDYDKFVYCLPIEILNKYNEIVIEFARNYLTYVLKYPVIVITKSYEDERSISSGVKFRYFEVNLNYQL